MNDKGKRKPVRPPDFWLNRFIGVHAIANYLRQQGVSVVAVERSESPEIEDDAVDLGGGMHVQVGSTYACVGAWVEAGTAMRHWPVRNNAALLLRDIDEARLVADEKPAEEVKQ